MNRRSTWIMIALSAVASTQAVGISSINGVKVVERDWNDFPSSVITVTNNYPTQVRVVESNLIGTTGTPPPYANRHLITLSADGGATEALVDGGNDTFEWFADVRVDSNATPFGFPRRWELGTLFRAPSGKGQIWENKFIITNDGFDVACFGDPLPFYSFTNSQNQFYTQGTTVKMGQRYFRDTDGRYKVILFFGTVQSPKLTLTFPPTGDPETEWNFTEKGIKTPYFWEGNEYGAKFGFYLQPAPNGNPPMNLNYTATMSNFVVRDFGVKGKVDLADISTSGEGEPVALEILNGSTVVHSSTVTLDANGRFALANPVAAGTYNVALKGTTHLRKLITGVTFTATTAVVNATLINGDVDGDNEVGPGDFGQLALAFLSVNGDPNWNANADLDRDGEVGPGDFGILASNFLASGD